MGLSLIILVAMVAIFYFVLIRPQRRRQQEHALLVDALQVGDKVITVGGIFGVIESINEMDVIIKVEDGSKLKFLKRSIMTKEEPQEVIVEPEDQDELE